MSLHPSSLLRRALLADAAVSGLTGLVLFAGADLFADLLKLPAELIRYAGLVLLPFAGWAAFLGRQERVSRAAIAGVIAVNLVWAVDSLAILALGWIAPNALGSSFVIAQALLVGAFAALQIMGMRTSNGALVAA